MKSQSCLPRPALDTPRMTDELCNTSHAGQPLTPPGAPSRSRLVLGLLVAIAYAVASIALMAPLGSGLTPDTAGYLEFSPLRQPLYGLWAHAAHGLSGSWITVQRMQISVFLFAAAWVIVELSVVSRLGLLAAALFVVTQI